MRGAFNLTGLLMLVLTGMVSGQDALRLPAGSGTLEYGTRDKDCGELLMNGDGTYESAYAWAADGVAYPLYGAFAECFTGDFEVCAHVMDITTDGYGVLRPVDILVWEDDGNVPGPVLAIRTGVEVGPATFWPAVIRRSFRFAQPICVHGKWWIGQWGDWAGYPTPHHYVGADLDGPPSKPMTNIAPGIGFPSGWHEVDVVWGPTSAMGLGAQAIPCAPVPVSLGSWGRVKTLFSAH